MTNAVLEITNSPIAVSGLDVIKQVNDFYSISFDRAFTQILWLLGILIGLLGIVVPVIYYFLQKRQLELKEDELTQHFEKKMLVLEESLKKEIGLAFDDQKTKSKEAFEKLENKTIRMFSKAEAKVLQVQGNLTFSQQRFGISLDSLHRALENYIQCSELKFVQQILKFITGSLLPQMNKAHFEEFNIEAFEKTLSKVGEINCDGLLDKDVVLVKKALADAQKR